MENSRHINRIYVERDHSLCMRRHERIDHAAVYQKCIKTNAEAYRLIGYSHAYRTQPNRGICVSREMLTQIARYAITRCVSPELLVFVYVIILVLTLFLFFRPSPPKCQRTFRKIKLQLGQIWRY